jgi:hypothetical protein
MKCVRDAALVRQMNKIYKILVRRPQGQRPFGKHKCRWRILLKRILNNVDRIKLAQDWIAVV